MKRKQIRKQMKRQKRSHLYLKGVATTTALVSAVNLLPVHTFATSVNDTQETGVEVLEQSSVETETSFSSENEESVSQEESQESTVDSITEGGKTSESVSETETMTESTVDATDSDTEKTEIPMLSESERIALETKIMPNIDSVLARSNTQQAFIQQAGPMAQQVASANDLYASVMIAQAILESGWGQSALTKQANNMFGIKGSYKGQYVEMRTLEDDGKGNLYEIVAKFRKYPSLKESFEDNAYVLKTTSFSPGTYYYSGAWKSNTSSYRDATKWLQGRYATDTSYASKLNNLIETYNLTQYDSKTGSSSNNTVTSPEQAINKQLKATDSLNIRSDASTSASIVGTLVKNTTFKAVAQKKGTSVNGNDTWYRVEGKGWVSGAYVTEVGSSNSNSGSEQAINKQLKTTATLNIRSNASTSASIVGSLAKNATFKAVAQKKGTSVNGNSTWYRIEGKGWVSGAYVTSVGSNNSNTGSEQAINKQLKTTATLNIRSNASTSASIVGSLAQNTTFKAVAQKKGTSVNGNDTWYRIDGKGWVSGAYVTTGSSNVSSNKTYYTVKSGDTLWSISQRFGISVNQLMQWNNISSSVIFVGQKLLVSK